MPKESKTPKSFNEKDLTEQELTDFTYVKQRIEGLRNYRTSQENGDIESIWADADKDYVPHRLRGRTKKRIVTDESKGWRGALVNLGESNWQSDISQPNPYIKIQIALSILVDQNPEGVFSASSKKFTATTELMRQLYKRSWETAKSKNQLKLFVFNLAKYGWATARTYPLRITRKVRALIEFNQENPDNSVYEEKEVIEFNDIFRKNLNPWNVWLDDMALPDHQFSIRDWAWREVYSMDSFKEEFGSWKRADLVQPGGVTTETLNTKSATSEKQFIQKDLVEVYFYENRLKDLFMVIANGIPVIISPLPISDSKGLKKLSLWQTYWNLRSATCPFGIGIYEAMRYDQNLIDRIRNMTIDQLTLSIYKMFFYQGTQSLQETGDIRITPGVGKQVLDPKNINWLQIPGPGNEAWNGLDKFEQDMDKASGITDPLLGTVTGKTAFEIAQAKEAALKRLKNPLENITEALNTEAYITVSLSQILYSIPEVYKISDPLLIEEYLKEIESEPQLYERDEEGSFKAKIFPEFPLNLDKDDQGNLIETKETQFFRVMPNSLNWEGVINIKSQSVLTSSQQLEKTLTMEMYQMIIPLLAQPPQLYEKVVKDIIKLYDRDPKDILPESWINPVTEETQPLFIPSGAEGIQGESTQTNPGGVIQPRAEGTISKLSGKLGGLNPFK